MTAATLARVKAPKLSEDIVLALLDQRGGWIIQDSTEAGDGTVYAVERLTDAQLDDPDILPLVDYAEAAYARTQATAGQVAKALTARYANLHARGLL